MTRRILRGLFVQYTKVLDTDAANASRLTGPFQVKIRMTVNRTVMMTGQPFHRTHTAIFECKPLVYKRVVPLILRRCDFWQLRLTGMGDAVIYSIAAERYGGEWQQA